LIRGKCAFTQKLQDEAHLVAWSPQANSYALALKSGIAIFDSNGKRLHDVKVAHYIVDMKYLAVRSRSSLFASFALVLTQTGGRDCDGTGEW
jgi:hypothetical protein